MTVYALQYDNWYGETWIRSIWTTPELAFAAREEVAAEDKDLNHWYVIRWELDNPDWWHRGTKPIQEPTR